MAFNSIKDYHKEDQSSSGLRWNITFNSIKDYHSTGVSPKTTLSKTFNSIKDYQDLINHFSWASKYDFQFHQGLSPELLMDNYDEDYVTFNSIKDYPGKPPADAVITYSSFQFHQGLSEYFYTLTILLFLLPLI